MEKICEREAAVTRQTSEAGLATTAAKLTGYAVVFNSKSQLLTENGRSFYEVIQPGAFDLKARNITFVYKHNDDAEYGDTQSGTLRLEQDSKGIKFELDLPAYANTLRSRIETGVIRGMSFAFYPREVEMIDGVQHVKKGELLHVSPVYNPAYSQTEVKIKLPSTDAKRKKIEVLSK